MLEVVLCAWAAVCTVFGLRWLMGPNTENTEVQFRMKSHVNDRELEIEVTVLARNGYAWRAVQRFQEEDIGQILRVCCASLDALPKERTHGIQRED